MSQRGLTLTELIVVVIILAILASLAMPRYLRTTEKGRSAEARNILGMIREAEEAYRQEFGYYATTLAALNLTLPSSCNATYYFTYNLSGDTATYTARADRCTSGGKAPQGIVNFTLNITQDGVLSGDAAFL